MTRTAVAESSPRASSSNRLVSWFANPWAEARFLWVIAIAYVLWTLLPVAIAVVFSFNASRALTAWQGFSTRWYAGDVNSVWNDPELRSALLQSLKLSILVVVIAVPLGVGFALALDRWRGRGSGTANFLMLFSFITPEVAIAIALLLFFSRVVTAVGLGFASQVLGVSMYMMAYPVIVVRARMLSIGREYEEAAMDLGASPTQALRRVLLPLLLPAIFASVAIVFAATVDNFVISQQLSSGAADETIPMLIYSAARHGPLPSVNALATLTLFASTLVIAASVVVYRRMTRGEARAGALEGLALQGGGGAA
jgi:spermidine/putrescine transport system permease protein